MKSAHERSLLEPTDLANFVDLLSDKTCRSKNDFNRIKKLGSGAFGNVFLVQDAQKKYYAMKGLGFGLFYKIVKVLIFQGNSGLYIEIRLELAFLGLSINGLIMLSARDIGRKIPIAQIVGPSLESSFIS